MTQLPYTALCFLLISAKLLSQPVTGFYDDFEDGRLDTTSRTLKLMVSP